MKKLVLIDGNSISNRAFYALPLLSNKQGLFTNAVYGFTQILLKILEEMKPDYFLVAFDAGKVTFRHSDFKEYKGKRMKTPSELSGQFPMIRELLDAFHLQHFELEGYEADDIIGTLSKRAEEIGIETVIYTGDKDMLQLASDSVMIYLTRKGITEVEPFGPKEIMDKYGLEPKQIIDLKGLMGDPSDNIPGVPGIGEKTALKLLHEYQTVEGVYTHLDQITAKKLKENLTTYQDQAILSKQLATIYRQVPIEIQWEDLKVDDKGYHRDEVYQLFVKWEFHSLIERLGMQKSKEEETEQKDVLLIDRLTEKNKTKWEKILGEEGPHAIYVETIGEQPHGRQILGLAVTNGKEILFINDQQLKQWTDFQEWLQDSSKTKWVFDGKRVEMVFFWNQIEIKGIASDLLLGAYLLNPQDGSPSLAEIAKQYHYSGLQDDELVYGKGAKYAIPKETVYVDHISRKAHAIFALIPTIDEKLKETNLDRLFYEIELPLSRVLAKMEKIGVRIDSQRLKEMGEELNQTLITLMEEIYELAGTEFNINSPKQLGEILFDKLQLPIIKKTKTGYSTSADVLEKLEPHHPIIGLILKYRQIGKLQSTYIEGLLKMVDKETQRIHTSFNQAITATGRLSSTEPNLQNIPIRLEEGRKIRQAFIPSYEDWLILSSDYSQIELRVLAHIAEDENLIEAFNQDMDIHTKTAMDVFGVKEDEVTSLMRRQAKAVNFGIVYGISDYGLSQNLNISRKEAAEFIERYFSVFSGVKTYMKKIVEQAKRDGYVSTLMNRRRYLPDIHSSNFNIRSFAERTAMNTPIQGTAADIIKIAMINIDQEMRRLYLKSRLLLQVHDELIFEVHPDEKEMMMSLVKNTMENAIQLKVPLKVDLHFGKTWYDAK
ncbi:DNA polymerase I [Tepidibacillus fermentans]|uniref:DNA polymerase I n=1 Tax=Tepidibacillus fermentans TaxID=1281767 RepID=A0A4R3KJL1_9BACI|nr:DNA polymerase I [Tepidibacillus fermentans]TCS83564.1 DNA polymerase I [Tepidibacillus fermentans]